MDIEANRNELALTLSRMRLGTAHEVYIADYVRDCADRNPTDPIVAAVVQDNGEVYTTPTGFPPVFGHGMVTNRKSDLDR